MTDKEAKKMRSNLKMIHQRIKAAFSFDQIKTWSDFYKHLGFTDEEHLSNKNVITFPELKAELAKREQELEDKINGKEEKQETIQDSGRVLGTQTVEATEESHETNQLRSAIESSEHDTGRASHNEEGSRGVTLTVSEALPATLPPVTRVEEKEEKEIKDGEHNNWGYQQPKRVRAFLYWHQKKAAAELIKKIKIEKRKGVLLLAPTGVGKTFDAGALLAELLESEYHEGKTYSSTPYLYITKASIVEQTKRVFDRFFGIKPNVDVEVINIEQLRASAGQQWIKEEVKVEDGEEVTKLSWRTNPKIPNHPVVVLVDESQGTKNKKAKQSQIIYKYNEIPTEDHCLVCISATPFARVSEAKAFAVSTNRSLEHLGFPPGTTLTNETWQAYAAIIANPASPEDYDEAAVKRLTDDLEPWIVRVKNVRPQFKARNGVKIIDFESQESRARYLSAWERFLKEKAKIDAAAEAGDSTGTCYLVVLLKFAMAAEFEHAEHFARDMNDAVRNRGKAAVAAVKFKQTLIEIVRLLITKYGWTRNDISLVWGGGQTQLTAKQKLKQKAQEKAALFKEMGIEIDELLKDTGLDEVEDRKIVDYPKEWRLEGQDKVERQKEIDKFQAGKSLFCIYTLKSGGVGLSLHHTDELTTDWNRDVEGFSKFFEEITEHNKRVKPEKRILPGKVRRKESGYAYEEDIKFIPVRPRETFVVVTYNAIELVQGVGRAPRLTSLSETVQNVYCFAGTVEVDMGVIYSKKLRCLTAVVQQREDWQDVIFGGVNRRKIVEAALQKTANAEEDDGGLIDEGSAEEEVEEEEEEVAA